MRRPSYEVFCSQVAKLHNTLQQLNVEYLFLKTVKAFPYADTNIDVLIPSHEHFHRVKAFFQTQGFQAVFTFEFDKAMLVSPVHHDRPSIHLYPAVSWYTLPYLAAEDVLRRAEIVEWEGIQIPVPSPEDDYLIHALHAFFEQEALATGDLKQLRWLRTRLNPERLEELLHDDPTVCWVMDRVENVLNTLDIRGEDNPRNSEEWNLCIYSFPEGVLLQGFRMKLGALLRKRDYAGVMHGLYAYGVIHVSKRLRLIRG